MAKNSQKEEKARGDKKVVLTELRVRFIKLHH